MKAFISISLLLSTLLLMVLVPKNASTEPAKSERALKAAKSADCRMDDLQLCRSCSALKMAIASHGLTEGEYYRGALWNPLYAAFVNNCLSLGAEILKLGANPNAGGDYGLFMLSLTQQWPHHNKQINSAWRDLVVAYGATLDWVSPLSNKSARELIADKEVVPDYPDFVK
jgi:hypothetical protein